MTFFQTEKRNQKHGISSTFSSTTSTTSSSSTSHLGALMNALGNLNHRHSNNRQSLSSTSSSSRRGGGQLLVRQQRQVAGNNNHIHNNNSHRHHHHHQVRQVVDRVLHRQDNYNYNDGDNSPTQSKMDHHGISNKFDLEQWQSGGGSGSGSGSSSSGRNSATSNGNDNHFNYSSNGKIRNSSSTSNHHLRHQHSNSSGSSESYNLHNAIVNATSNNHNHKNAPATSSITTSSNTTTSSSSSLSSSSLSNNQSSSAETEPQAQTKAAKAWRTAICPTTQKTYYWNIYTRESRWKKPMELATPEERNAIQTREKAQKDFFKQMEENILRRMRDNVEHAERAALAAAAGNDINGVSGKDNSTMDHDGIANAAFAAAGLNINKSACLIPSSCGDSISTSSSDRSLNSLEISGMMGGTMSIASPGNGSFSSLEADERDDKVPPLVVPKSKLERIKSGATKPIIDKPKLIRTISKMEYDFAALFSNTGVGGGDLAGIGFGSGSGRGGGDALPTTPSSKEEKEGTAIPAFDMPKTPPFTDILSSLHLTQEVGGVGCILTDPDNHHHHHHGRVAVSPGCPSSPLTPCTPMGQELMVPNVAGSSHGNMDSPASANTTSSPTCVRSANASPRSDMAKPNLAKRNTCGTIYLGTTLSAPDKDALIKCVCGVFRAHLLQSSVDSEAEAAYYNHGSFPSSSKSGEIFNDDPKYHAKGPVIPSLDDITAFYRDVFLRSQMEVDCIIISLIYAERLIKKTDGKVRPNIRNWRSVLFSCMVLASKVWDDLSMWNCDFSKIGPSGVTFSLQRTNELEVALLSHLEYKVKVNASEYAKYYFLLRSMLCRSGLANDTLASLNPLDIKGAKRISTILPDLPKTITRSKSFSESEKSGSDADFASSPQSPNSKRVSLEHLVRM